MNEHLGMNDTLGKRQLFGPAGGIPGRTLTNYGATLPTISLKGLIHLVKDVRQQIHPALRDFLQRN